jgi:hypothetical protein
MASGEMSEEDFTGFLSEALGQLATNCVDGALIYSCMDWAPLLRAVERRTPGRSQIAQSVHLDGGLGSLYRSKHELVFVLKNPASWMHPACAHPKH